MRLWPWKRTRREKPSDGRCKAMSGAIIGYRCELSKGHPLPHEAVKSITHTERFGERYESGRTTIRWPAALPRSRPGSGERADGD